MPSLIYLTALSDLNPQAKRTLQRLLMKHRKDRDDLNRRIEKLKAEGKDPNLPQKSDQSAVPHSRAQVPGALNSLSHAPPSMQVHPPPMTDSQNTVDESFMVLGGQRVSILPLTAALASQTRHHEGPCILGMACGPFFGYTQLCSLNRLPSQIQAMHSISSGMQCKACSTISLNLSHLPQHLLVLSHLDPLRRRDSKTLA